MPAFCQASAARAAVGITLVTFVSVIACAFASNIAAGEPPEGTWVVLSPTGAAPPAAPTAHIEEEASIGTGLAVPESAYYVGGGDCSDSGPGDSTTPFCYFSH